MQGIQYHRLMGRLVNTPLLTTPQRALALFGLLAPRAGVADDLRVMGELGDLSGDGPLMLRDFAGAVPRLNGPREERRAYRVVDGVAVIPIDGDLVNKLGTLDPWCGMTGYDSIVFKIDEAEADPSIRGVAFEFSTPGGEALGCEVCGDVIARMTKPSRALVWEAYSGGCWLASQCDRVAITRLGGTGSVGVVNLHVDYSKALAGGGKTVTVLRAGLHKAEGDPFAPLPADVRDRFVAEMEGMRRVFAEAVARGRTAAGRGLDVAAVLATEALTYGADDAVALGLADEIMSPDDALGQFIADLDSGSDSFPRLPQPAAMSAAPTIEGATMADKPEDAEGPKGDDKGDTNKPGAAEDGAVCDSCPHNDKARDQPPCRDCPDRPEEAGEGEGNGGEGGGGAAAVKARIKAIMASPQAQVSPALAQTLALDSNLSVKAAISAMDAAAKDGSGAKPAAFASLMGKFAGPALGVDAAKATAETSLATAVDREMARLNIKPKGI